MQRFLKITEICMGAKDKKVKLEKRRKMRPWSQIGVDTAENEPRKGSEIVKNRKNVDQFTVNLTV